MIFISLIKSDHWDIPAIFQRLSQCHRWLLASGAFTFSYFATSQFLWTQSSAWPLLGAEKTQAKEEKHTIT